MVKFAHAIRVLPKRRSVQLSGLTLRHFRNLGRQDLELPPEGVALVGDNAQGKSNFLEAIYYLETFRSFRGARDEQLVGFGEEVFRVTGTTVPGRDDGDGASEVAAAFERRGKRKKVTVDGAEPGRIGNAIGKLAAVIFSPADVELVSGAPKERRRFLDVVLSLNEPGYLPSLQSFRNVLDRRNASLKQGRSGATVAAWDPGLIEHGSNVVHARRRWVEEGTAKFGAYYSAVSDGVRGLLEYRCSFDCGALSSREELRAAFSAGLRDSCDRERRLGTTVVGPHRDDVRLLVEEDAGELDLRHYGSGGQRRTAALALRLLEADTIRERRGEPPLILLDDVFAELDEGRSERVLSLMEAEETGQVVLTAPKDSDVRLRRDSLPRWRIHAGTVSS